MKTARLTLALLVAGTTFTSAQTTLDTDGDGMVSLAEAQAVYPDVTEDDFNQADMDADGFLNETELSMAYGLGLLPAND